MQLEAVPPLKSEASFNESTLLIVPREIAEQRFYVSPETGMSLRVHDQSMAYGSRLLYWHDWDQPKVWRPLGHEGPAGAERCGVLIGQSVGDRNAQFTHSGLKTLGPRANAGLFESVTLAFRYNPYDPSDMREHHLIFPRCQLWWIHLVRAEQIEQPPWVAREHAFEVDWPAPIPDPETGKTTVCQWMFRCWDEPYPWEPAYMAMMRRLDPRLPGEKWPD